MLLLLYLSLTTRILFQIKWSFTSVTLRWDVNCLEFNLVIWIFRLQAVYFFPQMRQGLWDKTFQTVRVWDEIYTTYCDSRLLPLDRQTDRQTERQASRQTDRQTDRQIYRPIDGQIDRQTNTHTNRQTNRWTERTDRRTVSLFYLAAHLAMVTVRPIDLISRVYSTHKLVYRCPMKTK